MSPVQVDFAIKIIQLLSDSIQSRMSQYNTLVDTLRTAQEEGRDLTDEEVAVYEQMAEKALQELEDVIQGL